jgi:hypothetical protein
MPNPTPLSESVFSSYLELTTAASALNLVSDALGKAVSDIDDGLKKLNLGITAWVQVRCDGPYYPEDSTFRIEEIGYAKLSGKWGIALKTRAGDQLDEEQGEIVETWLFNEAPRALRLKSIEKVPELLKKLTEEASKVTKELQTKLADAQAVASAVNPPPAKGRTLLQTMGESQAKIVGLKPTLAAEEENALGLISPEGKK